MTQSMSDELAARVKRKLKKSREAGAGPLAEKILNALLEGRTATEQDRVMKSITAENLLIIARAARDDAVPATTHRTRGARVLRLPARVAAVKYESRERLLAFSASIAGPLESVAAWLHRVRSVPAVARLAGLWALIDMVREKTLRRP